MNTTESGLSPEQLESMERLAKQEGSVQQRNTARIVRNMQAGDYTKNGTDGKQFAAPAIPGVVPDDPMSEAGRKIMAYYFGKMLSHEEAVRQGDGTDPVHDMRVATRRLRSALRTFQPYYRKRVTKPFRKTLNKLAGALGDVRDLDVFRMKTDKHLDALSESERDELKALLDDWKDQFDAARDRLTDLLDSNRYARFVADFAEFVATPEQGAKDDIVDEDSGDEPPTPRLVRHVAPGLIYERYGVVRAHETTLNEASLDTLHRLRINAKRLRYALEALEEVLGPEAKSVIESVKAVQDHLGDLQDARVAVKMMQDFVDDAEDRQSKAAVLKYMAVRESEKQQLLAGVPGLWQAFTQPDGRRSLALAVAVL
jgi:CHAD domain-containing protein